MKKSNVEILKDLFINKEDAEEIAKSKKYSYIISKALEYLPEAIKNIRIEANEMNFETSVWIEQEKFSSEIGNQLEKILQSIGYGTNMISGPRKGWHINIYWRGMTDDEKNPV